MREMKDSGVSWIGEIPADWEVHKVFSSFSEKKEKNTDYEFDRAFKFRYGTLEPKNESGDITELRETYLLYTIVDKGDIVINCLNLNYDFISQRVAIVPHRGIITSAYLILKPRDGLYSDYFTYLFKAMDNMKLFHGMGSGVRLTLTFSDLKRQPMVIPPQAEQHRIVSYLDTKCAKIDAIIARQQQVIEKLKAYKLSAITEAVTRGLNPDVPMKDSGIEWIGLVPKHWEMVRLKFLLSQIIDCPHETPIYSADGNYLVIRTADQDIGKLRIDEDMYRLDESEYWNRIRRMSLEKDDIVYGREGERWGLACLVPESNKYCLGQRMLQFRCKSELFLPCFAMWALNSKFVYLQGAVDTIGSTSPHVNISTVRNFVIPVPKISEQREIAAHIDRKMLQLDRELEHREILIRKLNDYKKSLIYEVVTGKHTVKEQGGQAHG